MNFIAQNFNTIVSFIKDIVLVGLLGGYIKYLDYRKDQSKIKLDSDGKLYENESAERAQYRHDVDAIRLESKDRSEHYERDIKELQRQLDDWRDKYYKIFEKYTQIISSNSELRNKYNELFLTIKELKNKK